MRLIWTPLPQRRDANGLLHASIFVSPRLEHSVGPGHSTVLGDPEFERVRHWPQFLDSVELALEIDGVTFPVEREPVEPKWWDLLFADDTPVTSYELPDHSATIIHTYPVSDILDHIEGVYRSIAEHSTTDHPPLEGASPSLDALIGAIGGVSMNEDMEASYRQALLDPDPTTGKPRRALGAFQGFANMVGPPLAYWKMARFYSRPESQQPYSELAPQSVPDRPEKPKPDFHAMLGYLADFPALMRRSGLVIDVVFEAPNVPPTGALRVVVKPPDPAVHVRPRVSYSLGGDRFQIPARLGALHADNCLRLELDRELVRIYQLDVDGGAMKLLQSAGGLENSKVLPVQVSKDPGTGSVPSVRGGGITVSLIDRATALVDALDGSTALDPMLDTPGHELFLEDVLRGYRIDVLDVEQGQWRSLQRRVTDFNFAGIPGQSDGDELPGVADEATVRAQAATQSDHDVTDLDDPDKPGNGDLYLHEALFGWDGWSLAAPRPGKIIVEPGEGDQEDGQPTSVTTEKNDIATDLPVQATTRPEARSLPRLRYGRDYRMRARAVDLAGNSLPDDPGDLNEHVSPVVTYLRYEPVASPTLIRAHPDTEGESLELMVIRSDLEPSNGTVTPPAAYGQMPHVVAALAAADHSYAAASQRHVAPPKTSVQGAELSGVLDDAFGPGGDPGSVFKLALKEAGTFFDKALIDPDTGMATIDVFPHVNVTGSGGDPSKFGRNYVPPQGEHLYRTDPAAPLPYLPDPAAQGIALHGPSLDHLQPYPDGEGWWDVQPFRIRLVDGALGITPLAGHHMDISLPAAERVRLRLSSLPDPTRIDQLAHFSKLDDPDSKRTEAKEGRMWLLTPYRYLELVHATQHPLEAPELIVFPQRNYGSTFTAFSGTIENHAKSTGRLDVHATWSDPLDSGIAEQDPVDGIDGRDDPTQKGAIAFGWEVEAWDDQADVNAQDRISRHEFGDTKHHLVTYRPVATTRFREYFHPDITAVPANIEHPGAEVQLSIPNSARPDPPRVLYVVPTFGWEEEPIAGGVRRRRLGGGLRIYLDRPWYSSGRGEKLAVVLPEPPTNVPITDILEAKAFPVEEIAGLFRRRITPDMIRSQTFGRSVDRRVAAEITRKVVAFPWSNIQASPYYTIWGRDPIWEGHSPKPAAQMEDFPLRLDTSRSGLVIPEAPIAEVAVAAHDVHYDPDRELWYSDVEIDAGRAYFPFVRLGLARYQPESIPGAHLSPVVVADFIQLTADRTASLVAVDDATAALTVSGFGPSNISAYRVIGGPAEFGPIVRPELSRKVTVTLQERDPGIPGDLGWTDVGAEVELEPTKSRIGQAWTGMVDLQAAQPGSGSHRALIREYEGFPRDYDPETDPAEWPNHIAVPMNPIGWRIVYADTLPI